MASIMNIFHATVSKGGAAFFLFSSSIRIFCINSADVLGFSITALPTAAQYSICLLAERLSVVAAIAAWSNRALSILAVFVSNVRSSFVVM